MFQTSGSEQVKYWDEIKTNPYEKGKPSLISKLYSDRSKQGYQIDQLNNVTLEKNTFNAPIGNILSTLNCDDIIL